MVSNAVVIENRQAWIHRSFNKDKLFVRERYWHDFSSLASCERLSATPNVDSFTVKPTLLIPSGAILRKYLKLWMTIADTLAHLRLVLLESVVECMDWRNSSPCIWIQDQNGFGDDKKLVPEAAAVQEKNRLRKMLESEKLMPFCDLSVREEEFDEFDLLKYPQMSMEDRCRSAIVRAGRLLNQHGSDVVLVVEKSDLEFIHSEELVVMEVDSFLDHLNEVNSSHLHEGLISLKRQCEESYRQRNASAYECKAKIEDNLSSEETKRGLKDGSLLRGRLDVTRQNYKEAYVNTTIGRFFVRQRDGHFNRAIHQDVVIVKPLPENQWARPVGRRRLVFNPDSEENDITDDGSEPEPTAIIVAIAEPCRRRFVATLVDTPSVDDRAVIVVPVDSRIPKIRLQTKSWQKLMNQRLLVEIDSWDLGSNYPSGHCVDILGNYGDLETEIKCLLMEHEIFFTPFSNSAKSFLPPEGTSWQIPDDEIAKRRDLRRSCRIFSVDPVGCQDIDDAMHVRVLPSGDIEVGVHIADVTYFVPHNSALDTEAQTRATTFYLVDRRFDMLPSLLSSNLCSLHGGMDRLAVSVIWTITPSFDRIKATWFGRTIIHNSQAMTYEQAHNILHDKTPDDLNLPQPPPLMAGYRVNPLSIAPLKKDLSILTTFTRRLRQTREEIGGALDLSSEDLGSELKFSLDEAGNPVKVVAKKELEIHRTIAELMILANQSVAEKIHSVFPDSSLLRIHRSVEHNKFEDLEGFMKAGGIAFDGSSNMSMAKSLQSAKVVEKGRPVVNALLQSLATRAMSEALYVSTGNIEVGTSLSHFGLGIKKYTHFTSPIRRYADIVVHKQLLAILSNERKVRAKKPPPGFDARPSLKSIPDSKVISIMSGEGLGEPKVDDMDDTGTSETSDLSAFRSAAVEITDAKWNPADVPAREAPYDGSEVARICENLNIQNRRAKLSSMECQKLFLSLYFKNQVANAQAVITGVRTNGLVVFVPQFDLNGPVYLSDENGNVQLDPAIIGLPEEAGLDPTLGFLAVKRNRRFPDGQMILKSSSDDLSASVLEIIVPGAKKQLQLRILDVVTVQISCDLSDVKARVPLPRLHLVASSAARPSRSDLKSQILSTSITSSHLTPMPQSDKSVTIKVSHSLYEQIAMLRITPDLPDAQARVQRTRTNFQSSIAGRKKFADFVNPDSRSAQQEAAISAASDAVAQLRFSANQSFARTNEYDSVRTIERNITARAQKLAAGKRNTRKAKGS